MKKMLIATALVAGLAGSANVFAAANADKVLCVAASPGHAGISPDYGTAGTNFIMTPIAVKCSANVMLNGTDGTNGAWFAVGAASVKGKMTFKGHTQGGSVAKSADCAVPGGCTTAEVTTATAAANTDAAAAASS